jgi:hypothetical protein
MRKRRRTIPELIEGAGGPAAIVRALDNAISVEAVYKWPKIGIPDRHWPVLIPMALSDAEEMMAANIKARNQEYTQPSQ